MLIPERRSSRLEPVFTLRAAQAGTTNVERAVSRAKMRSADQTLIPLYIGSEFWQPDGIMALDDVLLEAEEKMIKTEEVVQHEFAGVRTGKASAGLVENIQVEAYGSTMRIRELAGITTPEYRVILIQPWDASTVHPIEKAIQKSNLGLNPMVDKKFIRIVLPELSEERRIEFTKIVRKMSEEGRVAVRHVRREALEHLKKESKQGGITEEELEHAEKEVQKLHDQYIAKIDAHLAHKEKEIMTV